MKLRTLPLVVATAAAVLVTTSGISPAHAAPAAPDLTGVTAAVAGHVSGDAATAEPWVFVGLQADQSDATSFATDTGTAHFDVPTWGYSAVTVHAWACPAEVLDSTCSDAATSGPLTATDVTLPEGDPGWFTDDTVGPGGTASVTITDAGGGGDLVATWAPGVGSPVTTPLTRGQATQLNLSDGDGTVTINRCSHTTPTQCTGLDPAASKALHVHTDPLGVAVSTVADITSAHPISTFVVTADRAGTYSMTYHLESILTPGVVDGTTPAAPVTGTLSGGGDTDPATVIAPASVTDGSYRVVGQITVVDPSYGTFSDVAFSSAAFTIHRLGPVLDSVVASPTTIYPLISGNSTYKSSTTFTLSGAGVGDVATLKLFKNSDGSFRRTLPIDPGATSTLATATWNGRMLDNTVLPGGLYLLKAYDAAGNQAATVGSVTVSSKKLVLKTWTHTYTPAGTLADKYVGKCSTLRKPSRRGWYYSLGYYANTKCASQTSKDSLISTLHAVFLPSKGVVQYVDIHVTPYSGAATAKPGSKAVLRYLTTTGDWANDKTLAGNLTYHPGVTRSTTGVVFKDHSFGWGVYTGFGYQYDVKSFTVVLHYKALG